LTKKYKKVKLKTLGMFKIKKIVSNELIINYVSLFLQRRTSPSGKT
jgi:hypothetical protein